MKTPIKSEARKLIFNMINKFDVRNNDSEKIYTEKERCLLSILAAIDTEDIDVNKIKESVKKLKDEHNSDIQNGLQHHCDLNAIEMIWSLAKRRVASKNIGVTPGNMEKIIKDAFESVTVEEWKNCIEHVVKIENNYIEKDNILETELESFIKNVRENDSDSDESFEMDFLNSDFDYESQ